MRFSVENTSDRSITKILQIVKPLQDSLTLYSPTESEYKSTYSGVMVNEKDKKVRGTSIYFPIEVNANTKSTFYLKNKSKYGKWYVMKLLNKEQVTSYETIEIIITCLLIGALLIISIYNIFLGVGLRDITYFLYALATLFSVSAQITVRGFTKMFLLDENLFFMKWEPPTVIAMGIITLCLFCIRFLETYKYSRSADWALKGLVVFQVVSLLVEIFNTEVLGNFTTNKLVAIGTFLFGFIALYAGIRCYQKGFRYARYFIIAWAVYSIGITIYAGTLLDFSPINMFTTNAYMVGSLMEVTLLSFALADRYNILSEERIHLLEDVNTKNKSLIEQKEEIIKLMTESIKHLKQKDELRENLKEVAKSSGGNIDLKSIVVELQADKIDDKRSLVLKTNIADKNKEFIEKLTKKYSKLTKNDIEIASFSLLGLKRKEIAVLKNTSLEGVKKGITRLRKKLELPLDQSLEDFIRNLD